MNVFNTFLCINLYHVVVFSVFLVAATDERQRKLIMAGKIFGVVLLFSIVKFLSPSNIFQTLLVMIVLFAGQQKGHPSSWRELQLRSGRSSWMIRVGERMQVCAAS